MTEDTRTNVEIAEREVSDFLCPAGYEINESDTLLAERILAALAAAGRLRDNTPTDPDTDTVFTEALWEAIAKVRDASPRAANDADSYEIVDAIIPVIAQRVAALEAERDGALGQVTEHRCNESAERAYQRVLNLRERVAALEATIDAARKALSFGPDQARFARTVLARAGDLTVLREHNAQVLRDFAGRIRRWWAPELCPWVGAIDDEATRIEQGGGS